MRPGANLWRAVADRWRALGSIIALIFILTIVWSGTYNRWTLAAWKVPVVYGGDALWGMAIAKETGSGEIWPIASKAPKSLGAPFEANWNDYPSIEEGLFAWWGILARAFGLFLGSNLCLYSAHLLAGTSFYLVCRYFHYERFLSMAAAVLFAFSRYAYARGLPHLSLTYYWHIPVGILVISSCLSKQGVMFDRRKVAFGIAVAIIFGVQNVYYTGMFMQLLAGAALYQIALRGKGFSVAAPLALIAVAAATFLVMNCDTFYSLFLLGPNKAVVARHYSGLEVYALKPIELLLPATHRILALQDWLTTTYFSKTSIRGEIGSPYLGVVGILGLGLLLLRTFQAIARQKQSNIPRHFWPILWILAFSVIGGINGILGLRFEYFRGTNRYSIFILAFVLLYLTREITGFVRSWPTAGKASLAAGILLIGLLDQIPATVSSVDIGTIQKQLNDDRAFVETVESRLPPRAMLFELPVVAFPEVPPVNGMADYEEFRPFLLSHSLRFSYGSDKGRPREDWQKEALQGGIPFLVRTLEDYGFSAVWINRRGYEDGATSLLSQFQLVGRDVLAQSSDFFCVGLKPSARPALPPEFDAHWSVPEALGDQRWRWSSGNGTVVLRSADSNPRSVEVTFELGTVKPRHVDVYLGKQKVFSCTLDSDTLRVPVHLQLSLQPGEQDLRFETDPPGEKAGNGDPRQLAFRIDNFKVSY